MGRTRRSFSWAHPWVLGLVALSCGSGDRIPGGRCVTNQNCPEDQQCVGGTCVPSSLSGCRNDEACAIGEYCDLTIGRCALIEIIGCSSDQSCPANQRCNLLTGVCIDGLRQCMDESMCAAIAKHCDLGRRQCVDCLDASHCTNPLVCVDGSCRDPGNGDCTGDQGCNAPSTVCEGQTCVAGCQVSGSSLVCGLGMVCNSQTGRCVPGQVTCNGDTQCNPPATICESTQCIPSCTQVGGLQCTGGYVCNSGTGRCEPPVAGCSGDPQCSPPATICENRACVPGCGQAGQSCAAGTACDSATGHCLPIQGPCSIDSECGAPAGVCENQQCVPGCGQVGGIQCTGNNICQPSTGRCMPGPPVCTSDANCNPPGTICDLNSGSCEPGCGTTGCTAPLVCNATTGHCYDPGTPPVGQPLNAACAANGECSSTVCFDFGPNIGSRCVASCAASADCPASFTCYDYNGAKMCVSAQLFDGATFAQPNGAPCSGDGSECHSNYCPISSCVDTCDQSSDCGGGAQCNWYEFVPDLFVGACDGPAGPGAAGAACIDNDQCQSGVCYGPGICGSLCRSTASCPGTDVCVPVNFSVCVIGGGGSCSLWQPNMVHTCVHSAHGADGVGVACTDGSNCRSTLCHTAIGQCTDTCGTDADCPATHRCKVEDWGELSDGTQVYVNVCMPTGS